MPWVREGEDFDLDGLVEALDGEPPGSEAHELLSVIRRALAQLAGRRDPVLVAQNLLELAVEWRLPRVERWAVAWLCSGEGPRFRLRWSSRTRDGRLLRTVRLPGRITALSTAGGTAVLGTASGEVYRWDPEADPVEVASLDGEVWTVAGDADRIFAGGLHARMTTSGWVSPPPALDPTKRTAGVAAAVLAPNGGLAFGDQLGQVRWWPGSGEWLLLDSRTEAPVVALAFHGTALRAVWRDGTSGEWPLEGHLHEHPSAGLGCEVAQAVFDREGKRLAFTTRTGGPIRVAGRTDPVRRHLDARNLAWSPGGLLASAGRTSILVGEPETPPDSISGEGMGELIAFLDDRLLVTAQGTELAVWDLRRESSRFPPPKPGDTISALAVDPADRSRTASGTLRGLLTEYDGDGLPTAVVRLPLPYPVRRITRHQGGWLVAAHGAAFSWAAGEEPRLLSHELCRAVASSHGRCAYAKGSEVVNETGEVLFSLPSPVCDLAYSPDGRTLAALSDDGTLLVSSGSDLLRYETAAGSRFLSVGAKEPLIRHPDGAVHTLTGLNEIQWRLPPGTATANGHAPWTLAAVHPDTGLELRGEDGVLHLEQLRLTGVATGPRRVVVTDGTRVLGYDVLEPPADGGSGTVRLRAEASTVVLPDGIRIEIPGPWTTALRSDHEPEDRLWNSRGSRPLSWEEVRTLTTSQASSAAFAGGAAGDLLLGAGLDLELDRARGIRPDRPVRLAWDCVEEAARTSWELIRPSRDVLGWFADPPVTTVRTVPTRKRPPEAPPRPSMLVVRGAHRELGVTDTAFTRMARRVGRSPVRLLKAGPVVVGSADAFADALAAGPDILQVWAHCSPDSVLFGSGPSGLLSRDEFTRLVSRCPPRLVVLVGCESAELGRALVSGGAGAVVAMRTEVMNRLVEHLVEEFIALLLAGRPIDLAFAEALRRYVLTGQPAAAAVPLLCLADPTGEPR